VNQKAIDELVAEGRIARVPVNPASARTLLAQAARHLECGEESSAHGADRTAVRG